jgi:hypothetical protein
METT